MDIFDISKQDIYRRQRMFPVLALTAMLTICLGHLSICAGQPAAGKRAKVLIRGVIAGMTAIKNPSDVFLQLLSMPSTGGHIKATIICDDNGDVRVLYHSNLPRIPLGPSGDFSLDASEVPAPGKYVVLVQNLNLGRPEGLLGGSGWKLEGALRFGPELAPVLRMKDGELALEIPDKPILPLRINLGKVELLVPKRMALVPKGEWQ